MSQFGVIMALIFSLLIAIFALANNQPIIVNYLYGKTEISAVIVILGAAILGAFVIFLLNMFKQIKAGFRLRSLQNELNEVRSQVNELKDERDALHLKLGQLQNSSEMREAAGIVEDASTTDEPYVTGHYMSQDGTGIKENVITGDETRQSDSAHSQEETISQPVDEESSGDQNPGMADQKDEKEL